MKILFLTQFLPYPLDNGGAIKTFQTLRILSQKHKVYLFCFLEREEKKKHQRLLEEKLEIKVKTVISHLPLSEFREIKKDILKSIFSPLPFIVYRYQDKKLAGLVKERIRKGIDAIHVDHLNMATYLPDHKSCLWVLEEHNIESEFNLRIFKKEKFNKFKIFSFLEMVKADFYEKRIIPNFDYWFAISKVDKEKLIRRGAKQEKTFFLPVSFKTKSFFSFKKDRLNIFFVGDLAWWPNKDGVLWFIREIFPLIKNKISKVQLFLMGRRAGEEIKKLVSLDSQIKLLGNVKSLKKYLKNASCCVAPLRGGGGVKIKVLTSLASGVPVVSTTIGAEGIEIKDGDEIILANKPADFAKAVVSVLKSRDLAESFSKAGLDFIKKNYNEEKAKAVLDNVYK